MRTFAFFILLVSFANAFAAEGVHTSALPSKIQAVFNSTIVYRPGSGFCSAFLIAKEKIQGHHILFFMSAAHCIEGVEGFKDNEPTTDAALVSKTISKVYSNVAVDLSRDDWPDRFEGTSLQGRLTPVWAFKHSKFEQSGALEDLLVIAFEVDRDLTNLTPVTLGSSGARLNLVDRFHYTIGFPGTILRPVDLQAIKIDDPDILQKRWSSGRFLSYDGFVTKKFDYSNFTASDADSFPGTSGGPLVLETGEVVGIVSHGLDSDLVTNERDYSYSGIKHKKPYRILAYAPRSMAEIRDKVIQLYLDTAVNSR